MRFIGTIEAKTDAKGRVFFPAAFRRVLQAEGEEQLVLRRDVFESCLSLYPMSVWNAEVDALRSRLNRWNARQEQVFRRFVAGVELLSLDANGRLLLPKRFLQMAEIGQEVVFVGMDNRVELWSRDCLAHTLLGEDDFGQGLQELMSEEV